MTDRKIRQDAGLDRRRFMGTAAALAVATADGGQFAATRAFAAGQQAAPRRLAMPPLIDTRRTGRLEMVAQGGTTDFLGRAPTRTAGFSQPYLGPTIVMQDGPFAPRIGNRWHETVTVHWHGMIVPGEHDGGPHSPIPPGEVWAPDMQIAQRPAMLWYHSHVHGRTALHVHQGLAGVIHHTDGRDDDRGLPGDYGVDDLTLVLQDRRFDADGRMVYQPDMTDVLNGFHGGRMIVNGQRVDTTAAVVPKGIVRLRLLNGSNARIYTLAFDDRRPVHLIGTDGGFLPAPIDMEYLALAPGERAEVLVDMAEGAAPVLVNTRGQQMKVMAFATDDGQTPRFRRLPTGLGGERAVIAGTPVRTRSFSLNMGGGSMSASAMSHGDMGHGAGDRTMAEMVGDFGINGRPYRMDRIDFEVALGSVERWVIGGGGAIQHPFHVHGVSFQVIKQGGSMARNANTGWKDVVVVNGETEILARFDQPAGTDHPFMYHCHILEHEDAGMMGQFVVR